MTTSRRQSKPINQWLSKKAIAIKHERRRLTNLYKAWLLETDQCCCSTIMITNGCSLIIHLLLRKSRTSARNSSIPPLVMREEQIKKTRGFATLSLTSLQQKLPQSNHNLCQTYLPKFSIYSPRGVIHRLPTLFHPTIYIPTRLHSNFPPKTLLVCLFRHIFSLANLSMSFFPPPSKLPKSYHS